MKSNWSSDEHDCLVEFKKEIKEGKTAKHSFDSINKGIEWLRAIR